MGVWSILLHIMGSPRDFRILSWRRTIAVLCVFGLAAVFFFAVNARPQQQAPLLLVMISVDGMRPDYITEADAHGEKVPNLRRFLKEGTHAEGVVGVVP